ncbi:zinc finger and BTB domain-containing protein 34-like [Mugil cephalus]|uniref:zinc finger and BTB domain-containing protein 34-like n=1 Tax=Mugil cephalus TaxID=48193 RepID=UPI001FB7E0BD|nr:zinc finger and BTB domain-containing protein 34-like [Mugil cephalus]
MEVPTCAQKVNNHAASLLAYLNIQRQQAQFCDCVLRQRQSPGQLYSAHRCVLAASSPVLASLLSSTGALVELQAPCLTDSVLALLLEYIYTGALPHTHSQQLYYSLLTAACHLQMDKLEEDLRTWQQSEVNAVDTEHASTGVENQSYKTTNTVNGTSVHTMRDLPPTSSTDAFRRPEVRDTSSMQSTASSPERATHQYSASMETCDEDPPLVLVIQLGFHSPQQSSLQWPKERRENAQLDWV